MEGACDTNVPANRVTTAVPARAGGNQGTCGVFGNVFYDLDPKLVGIDESFVHPYVGVGAGVLWTHFAPFGTYAQDGSEVFRLGGTGENFACQGIIGPASPSGFPAEPGAKQPAGLGVPPPAGPGQSPGLACYRVNAKARRGLRR